MVTGWKYSFSVDLQPLNDSEERPVADVYLLQENEFRPENFWDFGMYYTWDYTSRHSGDEWRDDFATSSPNAQNMFLGVHSEMFIRMKTTTLTFQSHWTIRKKARVGFSTTV